MKKIKIMLSVLAVVLAVGASAFTAPKKATTDQIYFYESGDLFQASSYTTVDPNDCLLGTDVPCSIKVTDSDLQSFLDEAKTDGVAWNAAIQSMRAQ